MTFNPITETENEAKRRLQDIFVLLASKNYNLYNVG